MVTGTNVMAGAWSAGTARQGSREAEEAQARADSAERAPGSEEDTERERRGEREKARGN